MDGRTPVVYGEVRLLPPPYKSDGMFCLRYSLRQMDAQHEDQAGNAGNQGTREAEGERQGHNRADVANAPRHEEGKAQNVKQLSEPYDNALPMPTSKSTVQNTKRTLEAIFTVGLVSATWPWCRVCTTPRCAPPPRHCSDSRRTVPRHWPPAHEGTRHSRVRKTRNCSSAYAKPPPLSQPQFPGRARCPMCVPLEIQLGKRDATDHLPEEARNECSEQRARGSLQGCSIWDAKRFARQLHTRAAALLRIFNVQNADIGWVFCAGVINEVRHRVLVLRGANYCT